jgi:hypothetical protein
MLVCATYTSPSLLPSPTVNEPSNLRSSSVGEQLQAASVVLSVHSESKSFKNTFSLAMRRSPARKECCFEFKVNGQLFKAKESECCQRPLAPAIDFYELIRDSYS